MDALEDAIARAQRRRAELVAAREAQVVQALKRRGLLRRQLVMRAASAVLRGCWSRVGANGLRMTVAGLTGAWLTVVAGLVAFGQADFAYVAPALAMSFVSVCVGLVRGAR